MYILIFCLSSDTVARSLHDVLFQKGQRNLRLITDTELVFASWLHEAGTDGVFFTRIQLKDGFIIEPYMIKKVVNRIPYFQMIHFMKQADRLYAEMEMFALYTSFLYSIKEKVVDGMPVRHINTADNALFFYAMAGKAGMDVLDNQFSSSPRWQQPKELVAMLPEKKQSVLWHKRSPHLVWENKPVLYNEPFSGIIKVEVIGDAIFCITLPGKQFEKKIKSFSGLTGRTVYVLSLVRVKENYKFYTVDPRPAFLSAAAVEAYAALFV